jgi:type I restriction enzyme S subunit
MSAGDFPSAWETARFEEILIEPKSDLVDGPFGSNLKSSEYIKFGIPVLKIQNIKADRFVRSRFSFITETKAKSLARHSFVPGDLIITKLGDPLGLCCEVPHDFSPGVIVADLMRLRIRTSHVSKRFILIAINSEIVQSQFKRITKGTTRPRVNLTIVRGLDFPLPPLNEQKRIVAKIEELFSELDAGEENLRWARRLLGVYRQSLLKQAFEGKLTALWRKQNPHLLESSDQLLARIQAERLARYEERLREWKSTENRPSKPRMPDAPTQIPKADLAKLVSLPAGWAWMTLESLSSPEPRSIQSGPFGSSLKHSEFTETGVLVIGIDNVREGFFSMGSQNRISPKKYKLLSKYTARDKDFLITIMATVGRCCRVPDGLETAIITKHVYRVSPNVGLVDPDYLVNAARGCPAIVQQIDKDKFGQTRPGLNGSFIKALSIPLCSLPEQQEIVRLLDEQFTVIEQNEREIDAALKRSAALRQSILKKAFTGHLVPQDPADEPAAMLLERIRVEREITCNHTPKKQTVRKRATVK